MLARAALLAARRARSISGATTVSWMPGVTGVAPCSGSMSEDRRASSSDSSSSSSSSGHMPHLARPTQDRRANTTKWSLLHEQGHDVNPCNSKRVWWQERDGEREKNAADPQQSSACLASLLPPLRGGPPPGRPPREARGGNTGALAKDVRTHPRSNTDAL